MLVLIFIFLKYMDAVLSVMVIYHCLLLIEYFKNIVPPMFSDSSSLSSKVFFLGMFECQSFLGLKCGRDFCSNGNTWKLEIKLSRKHQQNKLRTTKDCEKNHDHHGHPGPIYLRARQGAITNAINTGRRETLALTIFFLKHLKKYFNLHLIVSVKHLHDIIHKG